MSACQLLRCESRVPTFATSIFIFIIYVPLENNWLAALNESFKKEIPNLESPAFFGGGGVCFCFFGVWHELAIFNLFLQSWCFFNYKVDVKNSQAKMMGNMFRGWVVVSNIFVLLPLFGEDEPNLTSIFFRWVVQPPTRWEMIQILTSIFALKRFEVSEPTVVVSCFVTASTRKVAKHLDLESQRLRLEIQGQGSNLFGEATDAPWRLPLRKQEEEDDDDDDDDIPSVWAGEIIDIIVCI